MPKRIGMAGESVAIPSEQPLAPTNVIVVRSRDHGLLEEIVEKFERDQRCAGGTAYVEPCAATGNSDFYRAA